VKEMMMPKLFSIYINKREDLSGKKLFNDIIAGIIVAFIALPLSIALANASHVNPEQGIITAVIAGFLISFLGGSRVQIGGPTGAFVVIVSGIVAQYGMHGMVIATIMAGMMMIFFGVMKFGSVIKYIPYPITVGFTSGIAVVLLTTQINDFFGLGIPRNEMPREFIDMWELYFTKFSSIHLLTLIVGVVSLLIIVFWPKINKTIPGSLVALIVVTVVVNLFKIPVATIGSCFGEIKNNFTVFDFSSFVFSFSTIKDLIRPAITIAFLASIESLLSAVVADGMIGKKHNSNMELIAQGVANIGSVLVGGIPATGAIARTAANVKNGGRTPVAGIVHAIVLLLMMLVLMPLAKLIPMATLAAILLVVCYNMSEWRSFKSMLKATKSDVSVMIVTFLCTVIFDLVVAIEIGMVIAMFLFVRRMADSTEVTSSEYYKSIAKADMDEFEENEKGSRKDDLDEHVGKRILLYDINGPLFFGAANTFLDVMNEIRTETSILIFKMDNVPHMDATALDALKRIDKRCREKHILLLYSELNEQPMKLLEKTGFVNKVGRDRFFEDTNGAINEANEIISLKRTS